MANNYTHTVGAKTLTTSKEKASKLKELFEDATEDDCYHGMAVGIYPLEDDKVEIHIHSEESGCIDEVSSEALEFLGEIIQENGEPYLEFGVCWECDKKRPGEFGGSAVRVYPDGSLDYPEIVWLGGSLTTYLEMARRAMAEIPDSLAAEMDISDDEFTRLRDQLQAHLGEVES